MHIHQLKLHHDTISVTHLRQDHLFVLARDAFRKIRTLRRHNPLWCRGCEQTTFPVDSRDKIRSAWSGVSVRTRFHRAGEGDEALLFLPRANRTDRRLTPRARD